MARAYVGDTLVADQFYSGGVWDIGLDRLPAGTPRSAGLRLRVLPLPAGAPVYVPGWAGDSEIPAEIVRAELTTTHTWSLRPG